MIYIVTSLVAVKKSKAYIFFQKTNILLNCLKIFSKIYAYIIFT